jgi:hypothetical protein
MDEGRHQITAVFVSELRADLGFAAPLLRIADELARLAALDGRSRRTVFVVGDPVYCGHELAAHGHMVLPAPSINRTAEITSQARSYANLLAGAGFGDQRELALRVEAWDRVFALLSPSIVVADNSPVACLAARGRIPVLVTGSGFAAPPIHMAAFPPMIDDAAPETNQAFIRDVANRVLQARGASTIARLPELFAGDRRAVFAVPQLDPYRASRNEALLSPCSDIRSPLTPCEKPSIFFSLPSMFAHLITVVRGLEHVGATVSGYVPGPRSVGLTLLRQVGAHMFETRPRLSEVLRDAAVVVSASADLAEAAYLAGRPQLVLRGDIETDAMATELQKRHAAIALDVTDAKCVTDALRALLDDPSYALSAQEEARRTHAGGPSEDSAALVARSCLELIDTASQHAAARD